MDHKLNKLNSRYLSNINQKKKPDTRLCTNLAYDCYQGLFALSSNPGIIEIFDLKGERKTRIQA